MKRKKITKASGKSARLPRKYKAELEALMETLGVDDIKKIKIVVEEKGPVPLLSVLEDLLEKD